MIMVDLWRSKRNDKGKVDHFKIDKKQREISSDEIEQSISPANIEELAEFAESQKELVDEQSETKKEEPIGDLDIEERKHVEGHVGSEIEKVYEQDHDIKSYEFEDGQEWIIFKSHDDAKKATLKRLKQDLEDEPELFEPNWLENFREIYMSDTNKRLIAIDEANKITEDASTEELIDLASYYDVKISKAWTEEKMRDAVNNGIKKYIEKELDDPVKYFVEDQGLYSKEDLLKLGFISTKIEIEKAAEDALDTDGIAHFLSTYDGKEVELGNGIVMYRTN